MICNILGIKIYDLFSKDRKRFSIVRFAFLKYVVESQLNEDYEAILSVDGTKKEYFKHITDTIIGYNYNYTSNIGLKVFIGYTLPSYNYIKRIILLILIHQIKKKKLLKYMMAYVVLVY